MPIAGIEPEALHGGVSPSRCRGIRPFGAQIILNGHEFVAIDPAAPYVAATWDFKGHRGRKIDPEWANRRRLLTSRERLSHNNFTKMWNALVADDPSAQILSAWIAREELRTLLPTVRRGGDAHLTRHGLHRFLAW